ncbi:hypothetical protein SEA_ARACELI_70 [Streptomyces phage Araceli]|nr:hypothetical protein SEA_HENOCCUS_71 [Streptomyces phage Henoccus]QFG07884.1 hypothetical protein SEA_ARACELI_70 [Streptomyces phage Araceli]
MKCSVPGCPCLLNWRGYPPGTAYECRTVDADDMDVSAVLRRRDQPGAPGAGLSWHDKYRVFLRLEERGYSARRAALALGCSDRTIVRWRRKLKEEVGS